MSGWLDWQDEAIICPSCENKITILIVEDGDTQGNVDNSIAGEQFCPYCHYPITDEVLDKDSL